MPLNDIVCQELPDFQSTEVGMLETPGVPLGARELSLTVCGDNVAQRGAVNNLFPNFFWLAFFGNSG